MAKSAAFPRQTSCEPFRLNPLVACVRLALTGGMLVGSASAAWADTGLPIPAATWVTSGAATNQIIGNTLRIDQTTDKAILNWDKFNVDAGKTVQFVQPNSQSIALNRINQQDPSRIFGQIIANGQIYLYNKNGFVFGKEAVVNANSFMASTLNITDQIFNRGIAKVYDEDGGAALAIEPMQPGDALDPKTVQILIEAGAKIHTDKAGRIIIAAPKIENRGTLTSEEQGQVILAASQDKVYLQPADKNSPFAGLIVEVDTGGKVSNFGDIVARQGNVTMAGFAVNQQGRINATSSVKVNGSIRLLAQEQHGKLGNTLVATKTSRDTDLGDGLGTEAKTTLAAGSVTQVVADQAGGSAIDEQAQPNAYIEITGNTVHMQSGATVKAHSGQVNIKATDNLATPTLGTKGRIYFEKGAVVDVSGTKGVVAPIERNVAEISVQSFELRDAPVQRSGILKGETVRVDLRKGSKIVDTSGAKARVSRGIDERLGEGGQINLSSSGDIIVNDGATFDISGGYVDYQGGYINTTKLMTDYGRIVDISDADPKETYIAIIGQVTQTHKKWGVEKIWNSLGQLGQGTYEQGYREANAAGSLNIKSPNMAWNGRLIAGSDAGLYQRSPSARPDGGTFIFDSAAFANSFSNVRFQTGKDPVSIGLNQLFPTNDKGKPVDLVLSTDLTNRSNVQHVVVRVNGSATVAEDANIRMVPGAEFSVQALGSGHPMSANGDGAAINVLGQVHAAGGSITLNSGLLTDSEGNKVLELPSDLHIGSKAVLDVSGRWVNDLQAGFDAAQTDPLYLDGGSIKLSAVGNLYVKAGSSISADGGAQLKLDGDIVAGKGGSIGLSAKGPVGQASTVHLDGLVRAASLTKGGSLSISSGEILIGDVLVSALTDPMRLTVTNGGFGFDQESGFSEIKLNSNFAGLTVAAGTQLDLKNKNLVLDASYLSRSSGHSLRDFSHFELLPENLRQAFNLELSSQLDTRIETGSAVIADKGSSITLLSNSGNIFVDGLLQALAGRISLEIRPTIAQEYLASQAIWVGGNANLSVAGTTRLNPVDQFGYQSGQVLDGGVINFYAERGAVVLEEGSKLNVSGTRAPVDILQPSTRLGFTYAKKIVGSNAGSIKIAAAEGVVMDGSMSARAGSPELLGGSLAVSLNRSRRFLPDQPNIPFPTDPLVINIVQSAPRSLSRTAKFGDDFAGDLLGKALLRADLVDAAGFADVSLSSIGSVGFLGDVQLKAAERIRIDASAINAVGIDGGAAGTIRLDTGFLQIGSSLDRNLASNADAGEGRFTANARWIQLNGATQWNGFNRIALNSAHDIRGVGLRNGDEQRDFVGGLVTAANLDLRATQIYPTTLSDFTFAVVNNPEGTITISGSNTDAPPLSAGGTLTFKAAQINQNGVLKAPLGTINLQATSKMTVGDNSVTSVSAKGMVIPFGATQGGLDWLYPLDDIRNLVFEAAPEKRVIFDAPEIDIKTGSRIDVSGGGDLQAYEFQPGAGGSFDYLQPGRASYQGGFAILPTLGSQLAPYDHYESQNFPYAPGSTIYLSGSDELPAGEYAILPSHYALLPGAFLITPQAGTQDLTVRQSTVDGLSVVSGYFIHAGSRAADARTGGFKIENGADVRKNSSYDINRGDQFFTRNALKKDAPRPGLSIDAGQISLVAQTRLVMDGLFISDALAGGRGSKMDIAANRIVVTNQLSDTPISGTLEILAENLNKLRVGSLLLGGARSRNKGNANETDLAVTAQEVVFDADTEIHGSEFAVAATENVELQSGAKLIADRALSSSDSVFNVSGNGALLRVSSSGQVALNRTGTDGTAGQLNLAEGSVLKTDKGSILLDASQSSQLLGDIDMTGGSLNLAANVINIGEVAGLTGNALNLSNRKLTDLTVDELILTARDSIGVYGNVGRLAADGEFQRDDNGDMRAIYFDHLAINAAGLAGYGSGTNHAKLAAGRLDLHNLAGAGNQQTADGNGHLDLSADTVVMGKGLFTLAGFDKANLTANKVFTASNVGSLQVGKDLNLNAGLLTADGGSKLTVNVGGQANVIGLSGGATTANGFGGAIEFTADTISFNAKALLPSGSLGLTALKGDVILGNQASIDLAGRKVVFADKAVYTSGGHFRAVADHGIVKTGADSLVNVNSGGNGAAGGSVEFAAAEKSVVLLGKLQAKEGSAAFDVGGFDPAIRFDQLMSVVAGAGVNQSIYLRSRGDDILQKGVAINAKEITLVADRGSINLDAGVHADGTGQGGNVNLYAGDRIVLATGADLTANGSQVGAKGGKVLLSAVDADGDNISGIEIQAGSNISVWGNGAEGGSVVLRALRTANGINVQPVAGKVEGFSKFYAEGVKKYANADLGNDGQINAADITKIQNQTSAYMTAANMHNVADLADGLRLVAGVEINYTGDLALKDKWDLMGWRYDDVADTDLWDDVAGGLVIKTTGDFNVEKSLSDGFKNVTFTYSGGSATIVDKLQGGESWSYHLVAGADKTSADINATGNMGTMKLSSGAVIRTGSGDMHVVAGKDIAFTDGSSSIYNAGRPTQDSPYGALKDRFVGLLFYTEYPVAGGDLTLKAGGNIDGAVVNNNDFNDWLFRIGNWKADTADHSGQRPTAWGVTVGYIPTNNPNLQFQNAAATTAKKSFFQQNVGSFGGGNVKVSAGGNINNLDIMMPTTGKQIGVADNSTAGSFDFLSNQVQVNGGGTMAVVANGDIVGGSYFLGKGSGNLTAGGQITGGDRFKKGPMLLLGDTRFKVSAGNGVTLTGASDPMISHKADVNFFSYSEASALDIDSLSGDVVLAANGRIFPRTNTNSNQQALAPIYPASLNAVAHGGSLRIANEIVLFPSAQGNLNLFAKQDISGEVGIRFGMSDADRSLLPDAETPVARNNMADVVGRVSPFGAQPKLLHATIPVHLGDDDAARLVSLQGDIKNVEFNFPKKTLVKAGHDIVNLSLSLQHVNDDDTTLIEAGRDVRYTSDRDPETGGLLDNSAKIAVGGPGELLVKAGRNVDLGASGGISTVGNLVNTSLAEHGANLTILTGANGELDYGGFIETYLTRNPLYAQANTQLKSLITGFMRQRLNDESITDETALAEFAKLKSSDFVEIQPKLNAILLPVFFNEIKESGKASAGNTSTNSQRGYDAISHLFSDSDWRGDLSMFFSKIQTVDGGNVNLVVPGGFVNVGLATSFAGAKPPSELGIVVQRQGNVNVMVDGDFMVNTSRVFSLDGGDIMVWSSNGNIDAGRGAKSAIAAPPPVISFDDKGNMKIEFPPVVSGSGIRTAASSEGMEAGDVFLFAPKGVVDAGEAGIGGKNVFIAATAVLGAQNIQVSGVGTGVPVAATGSVAAGLTGTSNLNAGVSQMAESSVNNSVGKDNGNSIAKAILGMLSVELLGFGD
ncbi:filamentous haemagglutinin family protein [Methylomonas koyamae]|uniref:filamentous haemagglutinin family protein n=1 Tax=Methylomonas koyamae TaxID=702114 RepID=UPI001126ED56|nr:filamentous haemagglutinin family protein [Methylomonas koyamae]TPQ25994.1 hypothetical protein C2U68_12635 [Methylomonas koyamae]